MAFTYNPILRQPYPLPIASGGQGAIGAPDGAPPCWGTGYNSEDRTCRVCQVQGTCRNEVIRKDLNARPVGAGNPPPPPTQPYYPPRNYAPAQPAQYYQPQPQPQQPVQVRYAPPATQQQAARPLQPAPLQYGYGSTYDPMFHALATVPEPFRPQMQGESFMERVMKNMALAGLEAVMKEALLGVRQLFWWPRTPAATVASESVIDVTKA